MNEALQTFARETLKEGLAKLPEGWQENFKLMYGLPCDRRIPEDVERIKVTDINKIVDGMSAETLDWAMEQVKNSQATLEKKANG